MTIMADFALDDIPDLSGKRAVITGATGGLGLEAAMALAGKRADTVLIGRNPARGAAALERIRAVHPAAVLRFEQADLAVLASVAAVADRLLAEGRPIDILINNAGVMALPTREITVDGFETQLGVNYLSHFALTGRLLPLLKAARARVVQLSSIAHRGGRIRLGDLNRERAYHPWTAYQQSKLAMLMFAVELDRRSTANGWGLTSVAAHPGFARTDLIANGPAGRGGLLFGLGLRLLEGVLSHSAQAGTLPVLMAAAAADVQGGAYFGPQGWQEMKGPPGPARIAPQALDADMARRLWDASKRLTGVTF